jgi:hypothetical protein
MKNPLLLAAALCATLLLSTGARADVRLPRFSSNGVVDAVQVGGVTVWIASGQ